MTREMTTISLQLIFVTHLFDKVNFHENFNTHFLYPFRVYNFNKSLYISYNCTRILYEYYLC